MKRRHHSAIVLALLTCSVVCQGDGEDGLLCVSILTQGTNVTYSFSGAETTLSGLRPKLRRLAQFSPSMRLTIHADEGTTIRDLSRLVDEVLAAGCSNVWCVASLGAKGTGKRVLLQEWPERDLDRELFSAIEDKNEKLVSDLLSSGADIEARNVRRQTPLLVSIERQQTAIVALLITKGANIEARDQWGWSPVYTAVLTRNPDTVRTLIRAGVNVNVRDRQGCTPLTAVPDPHSTNVMYIAEMLTGAGADVNLPSDSGVTPLHRAVIMGNLDLAKYLISKGADVNAKMTAGDGSAVLHLAVGSFWEEFVTLLLSKQARVDIRDNYGRTPLHVAAGGPTALMSVLVKSGADINARDDTGRTPLHYAVHRGPEVVPGSVERYVAAVLALAPDVNAADKHGVRPIDVARQDGRDEVVKMLKAAGAQD